MPRTFRNDWTIGIDPPSAIKAAGLPHSALSRSNHLLDVRRVCFEDDCRATARRIEFDHAIGRETGFHEGLDPRKNLFRVLSRNQPAGNLHRRQVSLPFCFGWARAVAKSLNTTRLSRITSDSILTCLATMDNYET